MANINLQEISKFNAKIMYGPQSVLHLFLAPIMHQNPSQWHNALPRHPPPPMQEPFTTEHKTANPSQCGPAHRNPTQHSPTQQGPEDHIPTHYFSTHHSPIHHGPANHNPTHQTPRNHTPTHAAPHTTPHTTVPPKLAPRRTWAPTILCLVRRAAVSPLIPFFAGSSWEHDALTSFSSSPSSSFASSS